MHPHLSRLPSFSLFCVPLVQTAERALFVGTPYSDSFGLDAGAVYQFDTGIAGVSFTQSEFSVEVIRNIPISNSSFGARIEATVAGGAVHCIVNLERQQ